MAWHDFILECFSDTTLLSVLDMLSNICAKHSKWEMGNVLSFFLYVRKKNPLPTFLLLHECTTFITSKGTLLQIKKLDQPGLRHYDRFAYSPTFHTSCMFLLQQVSTMSHWSLYRVVVRPGSVCHVTVNKYNSVNAWPWIKVEC